MPARMRFVLCAALLIGGGVAAWVFRQPSLPDSPSDTSFVPDPKAPRRVEGPTIVAGAARPDSPPSLLGDDALSGLRTIPPVDRIASQQAVDRGQSPPAIPLASPIDWNAKPNPIRSSADVTEKSGEPVLMPLAPRPPVVPPSAAVAPVLQPAPAKPIVALRPIEPDDEPPRTHRIVDGDTLSKLAEKYLSASNRAFDIYEYNRDLLTSPAELPIGVELRIPPRSYSPRPAEPNQPGTLVPLRPRPQRP